MPVQKLKDFLDENSVRYVCIKHSPAYTSQEIAESAHIRGKEMAKVVMVKIEDEMAMLVLPASERVSLELFSQSLGKGSVELATEDEFGTLFPDCELGAMPPFGNLYDMEVFVSPHLAEDVEIAFNAGSHTELIQMGYGDFERLVRPVKVRLSNRA